MPSGAEPEGVQGSQVESVTYVSGTICHLCLGPLMMTTAPIVARPGRTSGDDQVSSRRSSVMAVLPPFNSDSDPVPVVPTPCAVWVLNARSQSACRSHLIGTQGLRIDDPADGAGALATSAPISLRSDLILLQLPPEARTESFRPPIPWRITAKRPQAPCGPRGHRKTG